MQDNVIPIAEAKPRDLSADRLWTIDDVAAWLQVAEATAYRIAAGPTFPKSIRVSKVVRRWIPEEVKRWTANQRG